MYAVLKSGGKQFTVKPGDVIRVEKLDKKLGEEFDLTDVVYVGGDTPMFGTPTVSGASVSVVVTQQDRGDKITILKRKRRKGYRRTIGHRQYFTELFISEISVGGKSVKADGKPHIIDPEKSQARKAEIAAKMKENKKTKGDADVSEKPAAKKVAKKAKAGKKGKAKKGGAKKKSSKSKAKKSSK